MRRTHTLALVALWFLASCASQPQAGPSFRTPAVVHANFTLATCEQCHDHDRPLAVAGEDHGGGADCTVCHNTKDDMSGWLPRKDFNHVPKPDSCLACHVTERPVPPHVATGDCAGCHNFPSFTP